MGVLIPTRDECDPVFPPDCGHLFDMGEAILTAAYSGIAPYEIVDGPCAGQLDLVVSLGQPSADLCDVLFAWLESYGPDQASAARAERSANGQLFAPSWIANWQVELWEAAYPTVTLEGDTQVSLPSPNHLHEINRHVYGHGISMYHALAAANELGTLYPTGECERVNIGPMMPLAPQGGCAGWMMKISGPVPVL